LAQVRAALEHDKANETQYYASLKADYIHIREQNLQLTNANDKLSTEYRDLQADMRVAKTRLHELKSAKEQLENQVHDRDGEIRCMEMELSRSMARCSVCIRFCVSVLSFTLLFQIYDWLQFLVELDNWRRQLEGGEQ